MVAQRKLWIDLLERAVSTYLESFFGLLIAANVFTGATAGKATGLLTVLEAAAVSALPAGLAVIKGGLASLIGNGDAAALPAVLDQPVAKPLTLDEAALATAGQGDGSDAVG